MVELLYFNNIFSYCYIVLGIVKLITLGGLLNQIFKKSTPTHRLFFTIHGIQSATHRKA